MLKQHLTKFCGALVACAFALGSPASSADLKMTFAMPTTPAPYLLPFFLAKDLGWLEKAGLTVEEKVVTGSFYGSCSPQLDMPKVLDLYMDGLLPLDRLVSRAYPLHEINEAFAAMNAGEVARAVIRP